LIPAVFAPVAAAAGLLAASAPTTARARDTYALGLATVAIAWVAMMSAGLVVLAEVKLDQSRTAAAEGRLDDAIERALEARTVQPWSSEPYTQLALVEQEQGNLDEALRRLKQAQARDSEDWRLAFLEVRLHEERGDRLGVRLAFERARELNPRAPYLGGS
jgi:tetratricopeptide (TPR) repeat protein